MSESDPHNAAAPGSAIQSSRSKWIPTIPTKSLSVLMTGAVFLTALIKADKKDIPEMVKILAGSNPSCFVGWVLATVFLVGGIVFVVVLNKIREQEINRLVQERDRLQTLLLDKAK